MREFFFSSPSRFLVVKTPTRLVFCLRLLRRPLSEGRQGKRRRAYNTVNYLSFPRIEQSWGTVVIPVTDFFCYPVDQEILVYRVSPASGVNEGLRLLCAYFFPLCALDAHEDSHRFSALALDAPYLSTAAPGGGRDRRCRARPCQFHDGFWRCNSPRDLAPGN